jgi:hypothetical protein
VGTRRARGPLWRQAKTAAGGLLLLASTFGICGAFDDARPSGGTWGWLEQIPHTLLLVGRGDEPSGLWGLRAYCQGSSSCDIIQPVNVSSLQSHREGFTATLSNNATVQVRITHVAVVQAATSRAATFGTSINGPPTCSREGASCPKAYGDNLLRASHRRATVLISRHSWQLIVNGDGCVERFFFACHD